MAKKYYVKNVSQTMGCFNLPTVGDRGRRLSLILARNDVSRALTDTEFNSSEVQKALAARALIDVSNKMNQE